MRATTSEKALLRALWEAVRLDEVKRPVPLREVAPRVGRGSSPASLNALELDAKLLDELGLVRLMGRNGSRKVELTQMGAFLADRLSLPE